MLRRGVGKYDGMMAKKILYEGRVQGVLWLSSTVEKPRSAACRSSSFPSCTRSACQQVERARFCTDAIFQERTGKGDVKAKFGNRKRVGLEFEC